VVAPWLQRRRHLVVLGYATAGCLVEQDEAGLRCLPHRGWAQQLQEIADCLGDGTGTTCWFRDTGSVARTVWRGVPPPPAEIDLVDESLCALGATSGLARWSGLRVDGSFAWELAQSGMDQSRVQNWWRAGFTVEEAAVWCSRGRPNECASLRRQGLSHVVPVSSRHRGCRSTSGTADCTGTPYGKSGNAGASLRARCAGRVTPNSPAGRVSAKVAPARWSLRTGRRTKPSQHSELCTRQAIQGRRCCERTRNVRPP